MSLQYLLNYVEENARDVSDLLKVADIRRIRQGDPWRGKLISDIREKYEAEATEDEFPPITGPTIRSNADV